jgi:hypothetical protein
MEIIGRQKPILIYSVKKNLDRICDGLLTKSSEAETRFMRNFFSQIVNCGRADAQDFVIELLQKNKAFNFDRSEIVCGLKLMRLYIWLCCSNVIKFSVKPSENKEISGSEIKSFLFGLFDFEPPEMNSYNYYEALNTESPAAFELEFSDFLLKNTCGILNYGKGAVNFTNDFILDAYESFIRSFTYYVSVNSVLYSS